jgi:protein-tyrosine phosphatase
MSKVIDSMYISGYPFATSLSRLQDTGITHVVNMAYECSDFFPSDFTYLHIAAKDTLSERLGSSFQDIASFVADAIALGGRTLVHCQEGISRSATAVLACLIINGRMDLFAAFDLLKHAKSDVEPNVTFLKELRRLEFDTFGTWTKAKLTPLDQCEDVKPLDWKESLAIIQANAVRSAVPVENNGKEMKCIRISFSEKSKEGYDAVQEFILDLIVSGLESFGGLNEKAGTVLEELVIRGTVDSTQYSSTDLRNMLQRLLRSEGFRELVIDVPTAKSWLDKLIGVLCQNHEKVLILEGG